MSISPPIQSNHSKVQPIVRAKNPPITLRRGSHGQSRRSHRQRIQKFTSRNHCFSPSGSFVPPSISSFSTYIVRAQSELAYRNRVSENSSQRGYDTDQDGRSDSSQRRRQTC